VFQSLLRRWPLGRNDREPDRVAWDKVGGHPMSAQDPLALPANALERGARAFVADIRVEAHPDGVPGLERVGEHHELRLGVRAGANGGAGEPRIADLADVGRRSAVPRMAGRPGPLLDIKEA
jgi:hypothetical protein